MSKRRLMQLMSLSLFVATFVVETPRISRVVNDVICFFDVVSWHMNVLTSTCHVVFGKISLEKKCYLLNCWDTTYRNCFALSSLRQSLLRMSELHIDGHRAVMDPKSLHVLCTLHWVVLRVGRTCSDKRGQRCHLHKDTVRRSVLHRCKRWPFEHIRKSIIMSDARTT